MADVRNAQQYMSGVWNWTAGGYDAMLPGRCAIGDIDGHVERSGHHLFIESKYWDGAGSPPYAIPKGQEIALRDLVYMSHKNTVLLLFGDAQTNDPRAVEVWYTQQAKGVTTVQRDWTGKDVNERRESLKAVFKWWADRASTNVVWAVNA